METLFSLGKIYPSDFLKPGESPRCEPIELKLIMDDEGFVKLSESAPLNSMYGEKYWYKSGISNTMRAALKDVVDSALSLIKWEKNDIFLDIASNDGTLLSYVPDSFTRIGIDPSNFDKFVGGDIIIQDYFSAKVYKDSIQGEKRAKIVTSIAMFYDLANPESFIRDVYEILEDDGLWVMQLSYSPLMINQLAFDNICHEHLYYYTFCGLHSILIENGFSVLDCQLNDVNGGSFRLYMMKRGANYSKFATRPYRDVANVRINALVEYENWATINSPGIWKYFGGKIEALKNVVISFIKAEKTKGKTIWAYGASTKGNTLLQYFGLDNTLIDGIAERNKDKWGLRTIGTNIPIYSEEEMRRIHPDYLLILPWHFIKEFQERERKYLDKGGKFIVPMPKFEII